MGESRRKWFKSVIAIVLLASLLLGSFPWQQTGSVNAAGGYNYAEVLQKAIYFYEAQRSGELPEDNRVEWRGDSGMLDGADHGVDLTGGWYDAGDHVKFGFPMAFSATMLAWSVYEYRDGYEQADQLEEILGNLKWATDYFLKAHTAPNELWGQVGTGAIDHAWWGPVEVMQMDRASYKITASCPGSDLAGETAAALASASIVFKETDPAYAATLLTHAEQLFTFADTYRGKYSDCITDASSFYRSWSGYEDELTWAASWLYLATEDSSYLTKAIQSTANWSNEGQSNNWAYKWTIGWDDKRYGAQLLLARITSDLGMPEAQKFVESTERNLDYWTVGTNGGERITYTPGGLAWLDSWGSLRYASNAAFLAFVYSDWVTDSVKKTRYSDFAVSQINYALGDNPRNSSYVVGFGSNSPQHPHHRTAHGGWADSLTNPTSHRHILYGALAGGPNASDGYTDSISDYVSNEVATDYNAAFTGALAKMNLLFGAGQQPLANFPEPETKTDEMFVEAAINQSGSNFTEIKALLNNQSGWPARMGDQLSFKYFIDLSELYAAGYTSTNVVLTSNYNQGAVLSLHPYDTANHIYYVLVDFTGTKIYPGGQPHYKKEAQFRIAGPEGALWNTANDYSYTGLVSNAVAKTSKIPVYDGGVLVYGQEPGNVIPPDPTVPAAPSSLSMAVGSGQVSLNWGASIGATSYTVKRATVSGGPYTNVALGVSSTSYTNTGLTNGTTYYYVVTAVNAIGESTNSAQIAATPQAVVPALPGVFTLSGSGGNEQASLSWTASNGALTYDVERSTGGGAFSNVVSGVTATSYTDNAVVNNTAYTYRITAVNAAGVTVSNTIAVTPQIPTTGSDLTVQYRAADTNATNNAIMPHFQITNSGASSIPLSGLKLRYYFTKDSNQGLSYWTDYAQVGSSNVTGSFVTMSSPASTADTYLEISFTAGAGSIAAGGQTGPVQARFSKNDWSNFDESNDYSYDPIKTAFADWSRVTLYQDGTLVWGLEPQ